MLSTKRVIVKLQGHLFYGEKLESYAAMTVKSGGALSIQSALASNAYNITISK